MNNKAIVITLLVIILASAAALILLKGTPPSPASSALNASFIPNQTSELQAPSSNLSSSFNATPGTNYSILSTQSLVPPP